MTIDQFREEIRQNKAVEKDVHFQTINPDELGDIEMLIYEKLKDGTLTLADFEHARVTYRNSNPHISAMTDSKSNFYAYIGNKLQVQLLMDEEENQ